MRKFVTVALLCALCLSAYASPTLERYMPSYAASSSSSQSATQAATLSELMYALGNLYNYLNSNFLYEIDNQKMQDAVISAMVDSLGDKYSYYVTSEKAEEYAEDNRGTYVGIGTYLTKYNPSYIDWEDPETYMVIITSPFPGGPADRAGIRAGDLISHVDGVEIYDLNATDASRLIRGTANTPITLTIHRGTSEFDITLMPEVVTTPSTDRTLLDEDVGYIMISDFSMRTFDSMKEDVDVLVKEGATSLIIDLRNNGGGVVDTSLNIANMFIPEGKTLLTTKFKDSATAKDSVYTSTAYMAVPEDMPIIVLVNKGTASASEILAGALQKNGRALLLGTQTFGKGIMQYSIGFLGGYLNLTVANYYTPDGTSIHEVGLTPDVILVTDENYTDEEMTAYAEFLKTPAIDEWLEARPEYTKENILEFAELNKDSGVPHNLLCLVMRNEYIYSLPYDERPIADKDFDTQLAKAISILKGTEIQEEPQKEIVPEAPVMVEATVPAEVI